jgi:hypothetical protein
MDSIDPKVVEALAKIFETLINGLFVSGLALAIYNGRRLQKAKKAGISDVEQVAAVQTAPQRKLNDPLLAYLRQEIRKHQQQHDEDEAHIKRLQTQIWKSGQEPVD